MTHESPMPPRVPVSRRALTPLHEATDSRFITRVRELETLCAGVYVAAVELGLPQRLLNQLWTVGARGNSPRAFDVPLPVRPSPPPAPAAPAARDAIGTAPIPDLRLIDRSLASDSRAAAPRPPLKPLSARRTVMVVDDEPLMLELLVRILQRENYEILVADCGASALQQAEAWRKPIDLLVTDFSMPDLSGRELAGRLREGKTDLPVLYQTGFSDMLFDDRKELEDRSSFLEKPFTARGLLEATRFMLYGTLNPAA